MEGGGIEIEYGANIVIKVAFAEVITSGSFDATKIIVTPISKSGGTGTALTALTNVGAVGPGTPNDGKNFIVTYGPITAPVANANAATLAAHTAKLHVLIPKDAVTKLSDPADKNKIKTQEINLVRQEPGTDPAGSTVDPTVVSITRATSISHTGGGAFVEAVVTGPFQVKIVLTEKPNGGLAAGDIAALDVAEGTVTSVVAGIPFARVPVAAGSLATTPDPREGGYAAGTDVPDPSGRDMMYHTYLASITPKGTAER